MPTIQFEGTSYTFPEDATEEEIIESLDSLQPPARTAMESGIMQPEMAVPPEEEPTTLSFAATRDVEIPAQQLTIDNPLQTPIVFGDNRTFKVRNIVEMNSKQATFRDKIAALETGGFDNDFIRTTVRPKGKERGSSAYGTFQITKGLLLDYLKRKSKLFTIEEKTAMAELIVRQSIALEIGGRDRPSFEKGGRGRALAEGWAQDLEYESVGTFLDAFDYGGDYGLSKDVDFKALYESFGRKMLKDVLKQAKGNELEAASIWHGGAGWSSAQSKKATQLYRDKFSRIEMSSSEVKAAPQRAAKVKKAKKKETALVPVKPGLFEDENGALFLVDEKGKKTEV